MRFNLRGRGKKKEGGVRSGGADFAAQDGKKERGALISFFHKNEKEKKKEKAETKSYNVMFPRTMVPGKREPMASPL